MGERISIATLHELVERQAADNWFVTLAPEKLLALVEAVEAAHVFHEKFGATRIGNGPDLTRKLARFDFDAPSPTEGPV